MDMNKNSMYSSQNIMNNGSQSPISSLRTDNQNYSNRLAARKLSTISNPGQPQPSIMTAQNNDFYLKNGAGTGPIKVLPNSKEDINGLRHNIKT
jgi:hypothetical protein